MTAGMTAESLMQAAAEVARLAGDNALRHYKSALAVERKGDGSEVTVADRESEQLARAWIEQRFADDGILGEEFGEVRPRARRRWVLDPIDGTKTFVRGVPLWGTLVGVIEGDDVVAGAIHIPALGELVAAGRGCGAWYNGARCRTSEVDDLSRATVSTTDQRYPNDAGRRARWEALARRALVAQTWGDCYGYVLVATGRIEAMVDDRMNPWDAAALLPVITEAGGRFTSWAGVETAFGGDAIATNEALGAIVREALGAGAEAAGFGRRVARDR